MDSLAAFAALQRLYADFLSDYADADHPGWLERLLQGGPTKSERRTITDFYSAVEQAVQELISGMTAGDGSLAEEVIRFMIIEAEGGDSSTQLTFAATQALAVPLLDLVSPAAAARLLADYQTRYPKKRMLTPRQEDLLKALKVHS